MSSNSSFKKILNTDQILSRGFTLIEMITVVAIVLIMTAILLGNLPDFRDKTSLDAVAQEVAIIVRQTQVFGSATRNARGEFPSQGIYIDTRKKDNFIVFADIDKDNKYDGKGCGAQAVECREQFFFNRGLEIAGVTTSGSIPGAGAFGGSIAIIFQRPLTDARFYTRIGSELLFDSVKLTIHKTGKPETRSIVVWNTGHIYVEK